MKDEIKEIFDINELFEEWKQFLRWCYENNDKTVEIHRDKLKWTMDYITNLQEENKSLKTQLDFIEDQYKYIVKLEKKIKDLQEIEKDHQRINGELRKKIERLNNIINTILDFNFFKEECPLNLGYTEKCDEEKAQDVFYEDDYCEENCNDDYKKCWLKYFERLQELKGSDSNE